MGCSLNQSTDEDTGTAESRASGTLRVRKCEHLRSECACMRKTCTPDSSYQGYAFLTNIQATVLRILNGLDKNLSVQPHSVSMSQTGVAE